MGSTWMAGVSPSPSCTSLPCCRIWDFERFHCERELLGHGYDVKSVHWHPQRALLVSGGKDNLIKLWDAKAGGWGARLPASREGVAKGSRVRSKELCTLHQHKHTVSRIRWNDNGLWFLRSARCCTVAWTCHRRGSP
jgi:polyadenylation factor subunit 2